MSTHEQTRRAHRIVDALKDSRILSSSDAGFLRNFLPELPKQKTLEEIYKYVDDAWLEADDPESKEWLHELHAQLKGLKDAPVDVPELPAGMRLADHWIYGRVVVAPIADGDGERMIFCLDKSSLAGAGRRWAHEDSLTFINAEPANPTHPEFLETEANYQNAPAGTVAAKDGWLAWIKQKNGDWSCDGGSEEGSILAQTGKRRVLRWGWINE